MRRTVLLPPPPAEDWAGTIGKKRDPVSGHPKGGTIYDCNPWGHTTRPWVPPRDHHAYAILEFIDNTTEIPRTAGLQTILLTYSLAGTIWVADLTMKIDDVDHTIALRMQTDAGSRSLQADLHLDFPTENYRHYYTGWIEWEINTLMQKDDHYGSVPFAYDCNLSADPEDPIPPSPAQWAQRERFKAAVEAWNALTPEEKAMWDKDAARYQLSGYNIWIRTWLNAHTEG